MIDSDSSPRVARAIGPRSDERPADGGVTVVGVLDHTDSCLVDRAGLVQARDAGWTLDWWIGADDRWYGPSREPSVRQRRLGPGPVPVTSMRVPSGDVTQTVYAVAHRGRSVIVVEIANDSPVPVALALAIRPYGIDGSPSTPNIARIGDRHVDVDGRRLILPRPPNELALSTTADLWSTITAGGELRWLDGSTGSGRAGGQAGEQFVNAVVMYPLPHGTSLRFAVGDAVADAVADGETAGVELSALPAADRVANGWSTVVDGGGRFDLPDSGLTDRMAAARARLLLVDPDAGERLARAALDHRAIGSMVARAWSRTWRRLRDRIDDSGRSASGDVGPDGETQPATGVDPMVETTLAAMLALAESGHHSHPARWLSVLTEVVADGSLVRFIGSDPDRLGLLVEAMARTTVLLDDRDRAELLLGPLGRLTRELETSTPTPTASWRRAALGLLALVVHDGQDDAAAELRYRLRTTAIPADPESVTRPHAGVATPPAAAEPPTPATADSPLVAARVWTEARAAVLRERVEDESPTIELLPGFPPSWRGGSVEAHDPTTLYGPLSFAVRWHGARPALLWDQGESEATLVCPSLDPHWSTTESRGDALLAGAAEGLVDVPGPGESFS